MSAFYDQYTSAGYGPSWTQETLDREELAGDGSNPPLVSSADLTNQMPTVLQKLGSFDFTQVSTVARDLGTAVGTAQREYRTVGDTFREARDAAATGDKLSTWWQYATMTDKIMVGLGLAGVLVAVYALSKD